MTNNGCKAYLFTALIVITVLPAACHSLGRWRSLGSDDYAVYAALLRLPGGTTDTSATLTRSVVVLDSTAPNSFGPLSQSALPHDKSTQAAHEALREAHDDLRKRSRYTFTLHRSSELPRIFPLVASAELDSVFHSQRDTWVAFRGQYPNLSGFVQFSCVGFSKDRQYALVWMRRGGEKEWTAGLVLLHRRGQNWQIDDFPGGRIVS